MIGASTRLGARSQGGKFAGWLWRSSETTVTLSIEGGPQEVEPGDEFRLHWLDTTELYEVLGVELDLPNGTGSFRLRPIRGFSRILWEFKKVAKRIAVVLRWRRRMAH